MSGRPIASPCVAVCAMNPLIGQCIGCFRTREEIAAWIRLSDTERDAIMRELPARRAAFEGGDAHPDNREEKPQ